MTLAQAALPRRSLLTNAMLVLAGSALVAIGAQISIPMLPVPMTLQTLAISIIGLTYGSRLAAVTLVAYLVEGAAGLPVFANGGAGVAPFFGPTAGFLLGFVLMAWLTGWLVERGLDRGFGRLLVAALVPGLLLFVPGVAGLIAMAGLGVGAALSAGVLPFVPGALVKAIIAAMAVAGGWKLFQNR